MNNNLSPKSDNEIKTNIAEECLKERVRQASYSFNAALGATGVSICIGLVGAALCYQEKFQKELLRHLAEWLQV